MHWGYFSSRVLCLGFVELLGSVFTFHQMWGFLAAFVLLSVPVLSSRDPAHADVVFCDGPTGQGQPCQP